MGTLSGLYLVGVVFMLILAVCWIVLPFALMGIKPILRDIRKELRQLNDQRAAPSRSKGEIEQPQAVAQWANGSLQRDKSR